MKVSFSAIKLQDKWTIHDWSKNVLRLQRTKLQCERPFEVFPTALNTKLPPPP